MYTRRSALLTNNLAMLLYGISAVLIGPTLPGIVADLEISLGAAGLIGSMQNAGGFAGALIMLLIAERMPRPKTVVVSFALLAATLVWIGVSATYVLLLIAFAASGLFIRVLDVMLNAYTGELAGAESGRRLSALHTFFGVGAFGGPLLAAAAMRAGANWSSVYAVTGAGYFLVLLASAAVMRSYLDTRSHQDGPASTRAVTDHSTPNAEAEASREFASPNGIIIALGGLLFFYAIHQIGVISWLPYFLQNQRGTGADFASVGLSMYWVGIIAGRIVASLLADRVGSARMLCAGAFIAAVAAGFGVFVPHGVHAVLLFAVAGVAGGATIPLAYSVGYGAAPGNAGRITAVLAVIMLAGRVIGPWLIGFTADSANLIVAMSIPAVVLAAAGALAAWIYHREVTERSSGVSHSSL